MNGNLVSLTEKQVCRLADDEASYQRGIDYYERGAVCNPVRQGRELRGECRGSRRQPYWVRVVLNDRGVAEASCSCPRGGFCKHIVALLLQYVHEPDAFEAVSSLNAVLARLSKEELITLIGDLVSREPALASVVELAAGAARGQSLDVAALRREVIRTLNQEDPSDIEADLRHILHTAERLVEQDDWLGAGVVYDTVLDGLTDSYEDELQGMDEDGGIACIAQNCVDGLSDCLASGDVDPKTRQGWLTTLMDAELADVELGGIDYAGEAMNTILEYAGEEDWEALQASIRDRMPGKDEWRQGRLVGMLVDWEEQHGRQEQARQLIRELGTVKQQVYLKIEEGQPEEAVALTRRHFQDSPGLIRELADALDKAGAGEYAVALLTGLADSKNAHSCYLEWLADYHLRRGQPDLAFAWQHRLFQAYPTFQLFKALRQIGKPLGIWPQARREAVQVVEQKQDVGLLIEIALDEQDVARALELLPKLARWDCHDYRGQVARAAESTHPGEAIGIYREMAEAIIEQRQRKQYGQAAGLLRRMRDLYRRLEDGAGWTNYLAALKSSCARLPALQEELRKAGL